MKTALSIALFLFALPAFASDVAPAAPASPPPIAYEVWGFRWDGRQYVKDAAHCLRTTDLKQAQDYAAQIDSFAGWRAATNLPDACIVHTVFNGTRLTNAQPPASPDVPSFAVWAFELKDGNWVKDDAHSWSTTDPAQGLDYAKKVNAVPGWSTTTNCPVPLPPEQRYVNGGALQGGPSYTDFGHGLRIDTNADGGQTIHLGGMTVRLGPGMVRNFQSSGGASDDSFYDTTPNVDNSQAIQDSINTQNMINTQDMINNQQMQNNIQDMINTQNMVNTQNMIDTQNMINAMNQ